MITTYQLPITLTGSHLRSWGTHRLPRPLGSGDWGLGVPFGVGGGTPLLCAGSPITDKDG